VPLHGDPVFVFSNTDNRSDRPRFNWWGFKSLLKDLKGWDAGLYALVIFCPIVRGCLGHGVLNSHKVGPNRVDTFRARCRVTTKNTKKFRPNCSSPKI